VRDGEEEVDHVLCMTEMRAELHIARGLVLTREEESGDDAFGLSSVDTRHKECHHSVDAVIDSFQKLCSEESKECPNDSVFNELGDESPSIVTNGEVLVGRDNDTRDGNDEVVVEVEGAVCLAIVVFRDGVGAKGEVTRADPTPTILRST
jgi:hypothetical protein